MENGATINAQGGRYGNALKAALERPHDQVVLMLLNNGFNLESAQLRKRELRKLQRVLKRENNLDQAEVSEYLQKVQELLERAVNDAQEGESTSSSE